MREFIFKKHFHQGLYIYHYVSGNYKLVEKNWSGLDDDEIFTKYSVSNYSQEETIVFLALAWKLTQEQPYKYAIPCWERDSTKQHTGINFDFVNWEYNVVAEGTATDNGFIPASTPITVYPGPTEWEIKHQNEAGLFKVQTFRNMVTIFKSLISAFQASTELNLFCLKNDRKEMLLSALRKQEPPSIGRILEVGDIFIDIVKGIDLGFNDSFIIKSTYDIGEELELLVNEYSESIKKYERVVDDIKNVPEFIEEIEKLIKVTNDVW